MSSSKRDVKRKAGGSCGDRICKCFSICSIQFLNIFDIMLGGLLVGIGVYILGTNHWGQSLDLVTLIWPLVSIVIGLFIFIEVLFSCCAAASEGRRYMATLSGVLAITISLICLGLGIAAFVDKANVYQYLETHKDELSDDKVEKLETWYITVGICMFLVSALQMIRFCLSSRFVRSADRLDDAYIILVDDDEEEAKADQRREGTYSKYDNLRHQYAEKYSKMENESTEQWKANSGTPRGSQSAVNEKDRLSSQKHNKTSSSKNPFDD